MNNQPFEIKLKQILYSDSFGENNFVTLKPTTIPPSIHRHLVISYTIHLVPSYIISSKKQNQSTSNQTRVDGHMLLSIVFLPLLATLAQASANEKNIQTVLSSKIAFAA